MTRAAGQRHRRDALRHALARDPLLTDHDLAGLLGVSVPTVRLDRVKLGIPEVRHRARAVAERTLHGGLGQLRGEILDLEPGVSALAVLEAGAPDPGSDDPALFADAGALAMAASGIAPASIEVVNVKFGPPPAGEARRIAKAEVLRGRGGADGRQRRVVLVQIRAGAATLLRAKFALAALRAETGGAAPAEGAETGGGA